MKEIKLIVPDWIAKKTTLYLVGGNEVIARNKYGFWEMKTGRCSRCGKCCKDTTIDFPFRDEKTGNCKYLKFEYKKDRKEVYTCAHPEVPWSCVYGSGQNIEGCTIKFERI